MNLKMDIGGKNILIPSTHAEEFLNNLNHLLLKFEAKQQGYRQTENFKPFGLELRAIDAPDSSD